MKPSTMSEPSDDRTRVRRELASVVETFTSSETGIAATGPASVGVPPRVVVEGTMRFGSSLVGPPGRLHGGLHAYARVFPVLACIPEHEASTTYPCRLALGLYRPLPLEQSVHFRASYAPGPERWELVVDHEEAGKLHTVARPAISTDANLGWFRDAYARSRDEAPEREIAAQGDIPMQVLRELVVMPASRAMRTTGSPTFARFADADGRLDVSAMCVGLDLLAAVTQGYAWQSHIFTTRIDLVVEADSAPANRDLVFLASRYAEPDPECHVRPVALRDGSEGGPTKVRVVLADDRFERAYAHGTFTLVPAKRT